MAKAHVICIDGPGGTGKGTLALALAHRLGWHLLDSGALYRILAHVASTRHLALTESRKIAVLSAGLDVSFQISTEQEQVAVWLADVDISDAIRSEECGNAASVIAASAVVRTAILQWQRDFRQPPGLVADGRDMGSVVFPDAVLKIYLTASPDERVKRRHKQLNAKGIGVTLPRLSAGLSERDDRDRQRTASPLMRAEDAIVIDTTACSREAVFQRAWELYQQKTG